MTIAAQVGFAVTLQAPDLYLAVVVNSRDALGTELGHIPCAMPLLEPKPLKMLVILGTKASDRVRRDVKAETRWIDGLEIDKPWIRIARAQANVSDRPQIVEDDAQVCGEGILLAVFLFVPRTQEHRQATGSLESAAGDLARLRKQTSAAPSTASIGPAGTGTPPARGRVGTATRRGLGSI